jgi:hypothetical protein
MRTPESFDNMPEFTRQSETESVCKHCCRTVATDHYAPLEVAESIHSDVSLHKPISPLPWGSE